MKPDYTVIVFRSIFTVGSNQTTPHWCKQLSLDCFMQADSVFDTNKKADQKKSNNTCLANLELFGPILKSSKIIFKWNYVFISKLCPLFILWYFALKSQHIGNVGLYVGFWICTKPTSLALSSPLSNLICIAPLGDLSLVMEAGYMEPITHWSDQIWPLVAAAEC